VHKEKPNSRVRKNAALGRPTRLVKLFKQSPSPKITDLLPKKVPLGGDNFDDQMMDPFSRGEKIGA